MHFPIHFPRILPPFCTRFALVFRCVFRVVLRCVLQCVFAVVFPVEKCPLHFWKSIPRHFIWRAIFANRIAGKNWGKARRTNRCNGLNAQNCDLKSSELYSWKFLGKRFCIPRCFQRMKRIECYAKDGQSWKIPAFFKCTLVSIPS